MWSIFSINGMKSDKKAVFFTKELMVWHIQANKRAMPWKGEKDPYIIWLSEIILQQTRVEQGMEYFNNFVRTYPNIHKLAAAPEKAVFKLWEGLGYYSRCRNLLATAKYISKELKGKFPDKYADILALKGVGPYTAAAIASFAYDLPYAVVDGNVNRVLARFFGISKAIDNIEGKRTFTDLANTLLDKKRPGLYNQAIMDLGAVVCKPKQPLCTTCVLNKHCTAFTRNTVNDYPVKEKKLLKKTRWFYYIVMEYKSRFFIQKRVGKDIWQSLHEFYLIEEMQETDVAAILKRPALKNMAGKNFQLAGASEIFTFK